MIRLSYTVGLFPPRFIQLASNVAWITNKGASQDKLLSFSSLALRENRKHLGIKLQPLKTASISAAELISPELKIVTAAITRASKNRDWKAAAQEFENAESPNTILYSAIINAAANLKRYQDGLNYFNDMPRKGIDRNAAIFSSVLRIHASMRNYGEATALWQQMKTDCPEAVSEASCLTGLLNAAASVGNISDINTEMQAAVSRGMQMNATHYCCLLKGYQYLGDSVGAWETLQLMHSQGIPPTVANYTAALGACLKQVAHYRDFAYAQAFVAQVNSDMKRCAVQPDRFLLEFEVAVLCCLDLKDFQNYHSSMNWSPSQIDEALRLIRQGEQAGLTSPLLRRTQGFLSHVQNASE